MPKGKETSQSHDEMKRRAEVFLSRDPSEGTELPPGDIRNLIEALRIHKIELEMKAEELRRTSDELEKTKEIFEDLYDFAPVSYITLDPNKLISRANLAAAQLLRTDRERLLGMPFSRFISPASMDLFYGHCKECLNTRKRQTCELKLTIDADNQRFVHLQSVAISDDEGNYGRIRMALVDITDRKRAEERVRTLSQELLRSQEDERQMISRELHDSIAQELSAIKMGCDSLMQGRPAISSDMEKHVLRLSSMLQNVITAVRDLSYELRPPHLEKSNLVQTLSSLCREFSDNTGIQIDFFSVGMEPLAFNDFAMINIYRLIQEGLNNIQKHAQASHVNVTVSYAHPDILIRITDNGRGFDTKKRLAALTSEKRMGLRSMEERAKLLGGEMTLRSQAMKGTGIHIRLPYGEKLSE